MGRIVGERVVRDRGVWPFGKGPLWTWRTAIEGNRLGVRACAWKARLL
jgi:hypothetical protein